MESYDGFRDVYKRQLLYGASERKYDYTKALGQGFTRMTLGLSLIHIYNGFIHLLQQDANLIQQPCTVLLDCFARDKSIFVGLGLNLGAVDRLYVKTDETLGS